MRLGPGRYHNEWEPEAAVGKVPFYVAGLGIGRNIIRRRLVERWNVISHTAALIEGQDEDRVLPGGAVHQRIYDLLGIGRPILNVRIGMLIHSRGTADRRG